jgi:hypothetical protein
MEYLGRRHPIRIEQLRVPRDHVQRGGELVRDARGKSSYDPETVCLPKLLDRSAVLALLLVRVRAQTNHQIGDESEDEERPDMIPSQPSER